MGLMSGVLACVITPGEDPVVEVITADLPALQGLVGGGIEVIGPQVGNLLGWHAYIHGEGKFEELPENSQASALAVALGWVPFMGDYLVGTVVFVGDGPDGEEADLPLAIVQAIEGFYGEE
jgi:hypothetical protein